MNIRFICGERVGKQVGGGVKNRGGKGQYSGGKPRPLLVGGKGNAYGKNQSRFEGVETRGGRNFRSSQHEATQPNFMRCQGLSPRANHR